MGVMSSEDMVIRAARAAYTKMLDCLVEEERNRWKELSRYTGSSPTVPLWEDQTQACRDDWVASVRAALETYLGREQEKAIGCGEA